MVSVRTFTLSSYLYINPTLSHYVWIANTIYFSVFSLMSYSTVYFISSINSSVILVLTFNWCSKW